MASAALYYGSKTYPIDSSIFVMGRDPTCDLVVDDEDVSRRHAMIIVQEPLYWLMDFKSSNGTVVNGVEVQDKCAIKDGDRILIGSGTHLVFLRGDQPKQNLAAPAAALAGKIRTGSRHTTLVIAPQSLGAGADTSRGSADLVEILKLLHGCMDPDRLPEAIVEAAVHITGAGRAFLLTAKGENFCFRAGRNVDARTYGGPTMTGARGAVYRVIEAKRPLVEAADAEQGTTHGYCCLPLLYEDQLRAVLFLEVLEVGASFSDGVVSEAMAFADHGAIAWRNALMAKK